jgi:Delta3-Delta2-enoyl-CoA isomerase
MMLKRSLPSFRDFQLVRICLSCPPSLSSQVSSVWEIHSLSRTPIPTAVEMLRSIIDHKKVFVLALNGPGVGGGAAWFEGVADIVLAAEGAYLQVPFNALGLVPENGSAISFSQSMGVHRANDFLMFGRQLTVEELEQMGMVNRIFPKEGFHQSVVKFLQEQLAVNDGKSMMETKRLQNAPLRDARMIAVYNSMDALAERFVDDAPIKRFAEKRKLLECKSCFPLLSQRHSMGDLLIVTVGVAKRRDSKI